jgi:vacuolar-type H+-ATPase subunit H
MASEASNDPYFTFWNSIREYKETMKKVVDERSTWKSQAEKLLKSTEPARLYRADSSLLESRIKEISKERDEIRRNSDSCEWFAR